MQNITENNKLIAEFMAGEKDKQVYIKHLNAWYDNCMGYKYNTDWNWLIEVVEKIYQTNLYYDKYIDFNSSMFSSGKIELSTNKESVYNACVEFIKWYNEQK